MLPILTGLLLLGLAVGSTRKPEPKKSLSPKDSNSNPRRIKFRNGPFLVIVTEGAPGATWAVYEASTYKKGAMPLALSVSEDTGQAIAAANQWVLSMQEREAEDDAPSPVVPRPPIPPAPPVPPVGDSGPVVEPPGVIERSGLRFEGGVLKLVDLADFMADGWDLFSMDMDPSEILDSVIVQLMPEIDGRPFRLLRVDLGTVVGSDIVLSGITKAKTEAAENPDFERFHKDVVLESFFGAEQSMSSATKFAYRGLLIVTRLNADGSYSYSVIDPASGSSEQTGSFPTSRDAIEGAIKDIDGPDEATPLPGPLSIVGLAGM